MADLYANLNDQERADRPEKLRCLLWEVLNQYGEQKQNAQGAAFVRELFFDPDDPEVPISPKTQVESLQGKLGFGDEHANIFAHRRRKEFADFAAYLAVFIVREIEKENERIKAERIKERGEQERLEAERIKQIAEKERVEAERTKKEAKKQKERVKKEAQKERVRATDDEDVVPTVVGPGKAKGRRRPTPDQRKRQLAREKFLRQQQRRDEKRKNERVRNSVIAAVLATVFGGSLFFYLTDSLPQWLR
nr:hypothetical protein [Streptomyces prunicolor]